MSSTATNRQISAVLAALAVALSPGMARAWDEGASASVLIKKAALEAGARIDYTLDSLKAGETYRLLVTLIGRPVAPNDRLRVSLRDGASVRISKELHAGDPDFYLPYRPSRDGNARITLARSPGADATPLNVRLEWAQMSVDASDRAAIEAEPNDSWRQANELRLGRDVYGSADDVDYLENTQRRQVGPRLVPVRGHRREADPRLLPARPARPRRLGQSPGLHGRPQDRPARALSRRQRPDGDRPRPRARAVLQAHQPHVHPRDLLPRGQRQPSRLHPPHPRAARAALRRARRRRSRPGCTTS